MKKIKELSDKTKLSPEMVEAILVKDHLLTHHYKKKELCTINLNFKDGEVDAERYFLSVAKTLKVSFSAVVGALLATQIKEGMISNGKKTKKKKE